MPSKEREDSFGNISSDINRWASVAVLHPLGKRQPHVRYVLSFGFVFPSCCGLCTGSVGFKQKAPEEIHLYHFCFCYFVEMRLFFWRDHLSLWWRSWFSIILRPLWSTWQCNGSLESSQITFAPPLKHFCSDWMELDDCWVHGHQICNGLINWQLCNSLLKMTWTLRSHR